MKKIICFFFFILSSKIHTMEISMDWGSFTLTEDDQLEITINKNVRNIIIKNDHLNTQQFPIKLFPKSTGLQIWSHILRDIFIDSEKTSHLKDRFDIMKRVKKSAMNTINEKFPINNNNSDNEKFSMSFDKDFNLIIENEHK